MFSWHQMCAAWTTGEDTKRAVRRKVEGKHENTFREHWLYEKWEHKTILYKRVKWIVNTM